MGDFTRLHVYGSGSQTREQHSIVLNLTSGPICPKRTKTINAYKTERGVVTCFSVSRQVGHLLSSKRNLSSFTGKTTIYSSSHCDNFFDNNAFDQRGVHIVDQQVPKANGNAWRLDLQHEVSLAVLQGVFALVQLVCASIFPQHTTSHRAAQDPTWWLSLISWQNVRSWLRLISWTQLVILYPTDKRTLL